jgi:hypothetical protein
MKKSEEVAITPFEAADLSQGGVTAKFAEFPFHALR